MAIARAIPARHTKPGLQAGWHRTPDTIVHRESSKPKKPEFRRESGHRSGFWTRRAMSLKKLRDDQDMLQLFRF
jgi:hypothetical protein